MPRNGEHARQRLQQAAVELFVERGYDQTTTAEIAARAGVTERTFFRHFPDKREVLFDGQAKLLELLTGAIARSPAVLKPLETLYRAFRSVEKLLEDNRPFSFPRQQVIERTPALQERELAKVAALSLALAQALQRRGVGERPATLAARTAMETFRYAAESWLADPAGGMGTHLERAFDELHDLSVAFPPKEARLALKAPASGRPGAGSTRR